MRYPWDATWPQQSETLKEKGITRTGKVPSLEYKGQILTQVGLIILLTALLAVRREPI